MKPSQYIVSQPGKQHTHRLCLALQKTNKLQNFYTTIWYKPSPLKDKLVSKLPTKVQKVIKKKYFAPLNSDLIHTHAGSEFKRQIKKNLFNQYEEKHWLKTEIAHDKYVSRKLKKATALTGFIGYEKSCLDSFAYCKKHNIATYLDLAQVHWKTISELRTKYEAFRRVQPPDSLFNQINLRKQQEYELADKILTLSEFSAKSLINGGIAPEKVIKVNLGFEPEYFTPKKQYDQNDSFNFLFVGTITERKGLSLLIEAFKKLNLPKATLTIVGPPADGQKLIEENRKFITYKPYLLQEELKNYYAQADVFVLPSLLDSWGMVVLEAMACGTPALVSQNTGSADAVAKGGGLISPANSLDTLADHMKQLYYDRNLTEKLGRKAAQIAQNYTWEAYEKQINSILE